MSLIGVEDRGGIRHLILQRAEKRNAFNAELIQALGGAVEDAAADDGVRVVIVRGDGPMFSSGMDLNDLRDLAENPEGLRRFRRPILNWWSLLEEMPKPTICQIHGAALGGAFELALACDFRTMAEDAVAGIMEVRVGLLPDVGGCSRLPAIVGLGNAKELIMTGKIVDGREAYRIGFANRVAPAEELDEVTGALANELLACAPKAVGLAKGDHGRRGQARPRADAGAGGCRPGDARRDGGLRRGHARLLREARPGVRGPLRLAVYRRPDAEMVSERGQGSPERSTKRTGPDAVIRARHLNRGGSGEPRTTEPAPIVSLLQTYPKRGNQTPDFGNRRFG